MPSRRTVEQFTGAFYQSFQRAQEQAAIDRRKREFQEEIGREYQILTSPDVGEMSKRIAYGKLQARGVTPPARLLQRKSDWKPLLQELNIPQNTWKAFDGLTVNEFVSLVNMFPEMDDKQNITSLFQYLEDKGHIKPGQAEKYLSYSSVREHLSTAVGDQLARSMEILPEKTVAGVKSREQAIAWSNLATKIDSGDIRSEKDMSADEKAIFHDSFKTPVSKRWFFEKAGNIDDMLKAGRNKITDITNSLTMNGFLHANRFEKWLIGTLEEGQLKEHYDKYYSKVTGTIKIEAEMAEAELVFDQIKELETKLSLKPTERSLLEMLIISTPMQIERMKKHPELIDLELKNIGSNKTSADIFKMYDDLK